jgi:flavin reductase (DIM6/NTAB) family NADH-FMN oxidoreductase RutF|tara:strand:+ start:579 stop:1067 length:489 start_codon:yes stop_codon:yes gene_type:complete
MTLPIFTSEKFRQVLGSFPTGVTIVTTKDGKENRGLTVNSFCSVSLNPPLVLIGIEKEHKTHKLVKNSGVFAVNILREDQKELAERFSKINRRRERFKDLSTWVAVTGSPILEGCLAFIDCKVVSEYSGGDHTLFLAQAEAIGSAEDQGKALVFHQGKYTSV